MKKITTIDPPIDKPFLEEELGLPQYKIAPVVGFVDNAICFDETYEQSLKELYIEYKNNCQHSIPLGKLTFQKVFLNYADHKHHKINVFKTPKGVVYQGAVLKK